MDLVIFAGGSVAAPVSAWQMQVSIKHRLCWLQNGWELRGASLLPWQLQSAPVLEFWGSVIPAEAVNYLGPKLDSYLKKWHIRTQTWVDLKSPQAWFNIKNFFVLEASLVFYRSIVPAQPQSWMVIIHQTWKWSQAAFRLGPGCQWAATRRWGEDSSLSLL